MGPTGRAMRYAAMAAVLVGCGATQSPTTGNDAAATDAQGGTDVVAMDVVAEDVVRADVVQRDAQKGSDVIDAAAPMDVVVDASAPSDAGGKPDASPADGSAPGDAAAPTDAPRGDASTFTCPMGIREIVLPGTVAPITGTTAGMSTLASSTCQSNAGGPEHFYTLRVTERTGVILSTEGMETAYDTIVTIRRCDTGAEVACDDDGGETPGTSSITRAVLDPGTYTVVVDGYNTGAGAYVLNARTYAIAPNAVCTGAVTLAPGASLMNQDLLGTGAPSTACDRGSDSGPLYYSVTVPPSSAVTVTATAVMGQTWTATLRGLDDCASTMCAALGTGGSVALGNTTTMPRTYRVAVARSFSTTPGAFDLTASMPTPLAMNATCAAATTLAPGAMLTGQDLGAAAAPSTLCARTTDSAALYYSVTVPASSRVNLTLTPTAPMGVTWTPSIRVLDACDAMTCVLSRAATTPTELVNTGTTPRTYRVIIARSATASPGVFTLAASAPSALASNAACGMSLSLPPSGLTNQNLAGSALPSAACLTSSVGGQLFYSVTVPANSAATVVARPTGTTPMWTPVVRLLDACDATTCAANATGTAGTPATLLVVNGGSTERSYKLSVAATAAGVEGTFDLEFSSRTVGPATVCERPTALAANGMAVSGDTALGVRRASRCFTTDMGTEVFYSLEVPAATRIALRAVPTSGGTWRPRIRTLTNCAATTCLGSSATVTMDGGEATLNVDNNALAPLSVLVSVSSVTDMSGGPFSLTATSSPLMSASAYALTTIPAMCDDVAMGSAVAPASGWTDDSASAIAALPFTMRFFGTDTTHFSVTSNGYAQLWTSMTGTPATSFGNVAFPSTATPNNAVAPYWDDLVPDLMTAGVRTLAVGTAPNRRFVIEWRDWQHISGDVMDSLTFQAKLFETTGVVEFHYCSMMPANDTNTGGSTTIGLEDAMGMSAALISYNTPNRAATGTGYRLTPR
jgi:hypothetical protein